MKYLLIFALLSIQAFAVNLTDHQRSYWHKLLHFRHPLAGVIRSEVDSKDFFIHTDGKFDAGKELDAFIDKLNSPEGQAFVCRFPLRYRWVKEVVPNQWSWSTEACPVYQAFKGKLGAKSLGLVFSSFYINNPGSTFGHTFLRVGRYPDFHHNELLDYAINFAAEDAKDNVFVYMVKGLTGFYPGRFSVIPYYYKIREYSDHEFRDVWNYDLALAEEKVSTIIDHTWELANASFDYYYFTENCSYHILGLLNVAYDDVDLLERLGKSPYVLPIDTVKELKRLGLIKDRKVRPSAYGKLLKETQGLSASELEKVKEMASHPSRALSLLPAPNERRSAELLDASISALDYLKADAILKNEKSVSEERNTLLLLRAENPTISEDLKFDPRDLLPPDESHGSSRLGLSGGYRPQDGAFQGLEWRAAQHDLLDPSRGQLKNSQVTMFDLRLRNQELEYRRRSLVVDRFRLLDLKKYQASDFWNSSIAWDFGLGADQRKGCRSGNCLNPILTFGVGNSTNFTEDIILTFLAGGSYQRDRPYRNDSLLSLGPKLNLVVLKENFSFGLDVGYFLPTELFSRWQSRQLVYDAEARFFISQNLAIFAKTLNMDREGRNIHDGSLGVYIYH